MDVIQLTKEYEGAYEAFLEKHSHALFYYSLKFKKFLEDLLKCEPNYLIAVEHGEIRGAFPMMSKHGKYGYVFNSLPFYGSNGGIIADDEETFSLLVEAYHQLLYEEPVATATVISNPLIENNCSKMKHHVVDERISQFTELSFEEKPAEELMAKIEPTARTNVRKAMRNGIEVGIDNNNLEFLRKVHGDNMRALDGKPKPDEFFELIDRHFKAGKDYSLYIAKWKQEPISALLLFYYNGIVEYYLPAIVEKFRSYQPLALTIYRAMIEAWHQGFRFWNWGGTWLTQERLYRFKKKWGAKEKRYLYYTYVKNEEIYHCQKEELLEHYGNFFVIPFSELRRG